MLPTSTLDRPQSAAHGPGGESGARAVLSQTQHFLEQSIDRHPTLMVGIAVAAGVALGCLIKR
jgi:ElaB/YqjD/DUF883 family membrane-anchored ribosome-binding protein